MAKSYTLVINKNFKSLLYFQGKIWKSQRSAVFYNLFSNNMIKFLDLNVKSRCLQTCNTLISRNHYISNNFINVIFFDSKYQNACNAEKKPIKKFFKKLWRFCFLVRFLYDVVYFLNFGFAFAFQIVIIPRFTFVITMAQLRI